MAAKLIARAVFPTFGSQSFRTAAIRAVAADAANRMTSASVASITSPPTIQVRERLDGALLIVDTLLNGLSWQAGNAVRVVH